MTTPMQPLPDATVAEPGRRTRSGIVALILGIVAIVFAFIPFLSYVAGFIAIAAVVVGIVALRRIGAGPKGSAIAGIVLGALALLIAIVMSVVYSAIFFIGAVAGNMSSFAPTALPSASSLESAPATAAGGSVVYKVTGSGTATTITYLSADSGGAGQEQVTDEDLPWSKTVGIPADSGFSAYSLVAQNAGSGRITCSIEVNGKVLSTKTSKGKYSVVSCSATQ